MARTDPQINIRVPLELKKRLEMTAIEASRSLNAEVVKRLEDSLSAEQVDISIDQIPTEVLMMELASRMKGYSLTVEEIKRIKKAP